MSECDTEDEEWYPLSLSLSLSLSLILPFEEPENVTRCEVPVLLLCAFLLSFGLCQRNCFRSDEGVGVAEIGETSVDCDAGAIFA